MSIMAWYPLPQSGSTPSAGDEFFETQAAGWSLWSFSPADGQHGAAKHGTGGGAARADQHTEASPAQPTDDMFMSQLSDEEVRKMDAPFAALDMFPDSMHRLMSYENMLGGVLAGGSEGGQDQNGVDAMDTCGFPLFSHDLQSGSPMSAEPSSPETLPVPVPDLTPIKDHQAGTTSMAKRSRSVVAGEESEQDLEALVLEELEDVVFQLTKRTRICFRDAFLRLAESTGAKRSTANEASGSGVSSSSSKNQAEGNTSRVSTPADCPPERETNAIDRTVACLTLTPPFAAPPPLPSQAHASRYAGDYSGAEAQSTTSWTAAA